MAVRRRNPRRFEALERRDLLSATVFEHGGIGYFLADDSPRLERYDIRGEEWLPATELAGATATPTVAHVDDDGIYVAYERLVYRYEFDGTAPTHLLNTQHPVISIHSDGDLLFINHPAQMISVDKESNDIIDTFDDYRDTLFGSSIAPSANRMFGRSDGVHPSDIVYMSYDDDGTLLVNNDGPYHADYPGASTTWVFPDESMVLDDSGTIYATDTLLFVGSLATSPVTEVDFLDSGEPVVLSGDTLFGFSDRLLLSGSKQLTYEPDHIFVNDRNVITFSAAAGQPGGYRVDLVPMEEIAAPEPGDPVSPTGLPYQPDAIVRRDDGSLLLLSRAHQSVFRWDPVSQRYDGSIPLVGTPDFMAYTPALDRIYLAYSSGLIRAMDLDSDAPREVPFTNLPGPPLGLATAGSYLFAADPSGGRVTHYTYDVEGNQIDAVDSNYTSDEFVWSDANQKMYYFRDGNSPNDIYWEEINADGVTYPSEPPGGIGVKQDSPLHSSLGFEHPIRVAPDGSVIVFGSGFIHDATTLERLPQSLANPVADAAWIDDALVTIRGVGGFSQLQQWATGTYEEGATRQFAGDPVALHVVADDRMVVVTRGPDEVPRFLVFDQGLYFVPSPIPIASATTDGPILPGGSALLDGSGSSDPDEGPGPLTYQWTVVMGPGEATIDDSAAETTAVTADLPGDYLIELTVSDGTYTATDTVVVTVRTNQAPLADASMSDEIAVTTVAATLDGSRSSDPDGDPLTYAWRIIGSPDPEAGMLVDADALVASLVTDVPGVYTVELTVGDGYTSSSATWDVTVRTNQPPDVDVSPAEGIFIIGAGPIVLDAGLSSDPDGDPLTFDWDIASRPQNTRPELSDPDASVTEFDTDKPGQYSILLSVSDGFAQTDQLVVVNVRSNQVPVADATRSSTTTYTDGRPATLNGTLSHDPDGDPLTYSWAMIAAPENSQATIANADQPIAGFQADVRGTYTIELTVSDGAAGDTDTVLIEADPNRPPVADATQSDVSVELGNLAMLDGGMSSDPDGDPLAYAWQVVSRPNGSEPVLVDEDQVVAFLQADVAGLYGVQLTVDDGLETSSDIVFLSITSRDAPRVAGIEVNTGFEDVPDRNGSPSPTSWLTQHSDLRSIVVRFDRSVVVDEQHLRLTNLGTDATNDPDREVNLTSEHVLIEDDRVVIVFAPYELNDGIYQVSLLPGITDLQGTPLDGDGDGVAGGEFVSAGTVDSGLYKLTGDFNGDGGVSIFDFLTIAYYFGVAVSPSGAPEFVDMDGDGGVSILDFGRFAGGFGSQVREPMVLAADSSGSLAEGDARWTSAVEPTSRIEHDERTVARHSVLADWNDGRERSWSVRFDDSLERDVAGDRPRPLGEVLDDDLCDVIAKHSSRPLRFE